jgi:hypothetical protein
LYTNAKEVPRDIELTFAPKKRKRGGFFFLEIPMPSRFRFFKMLVKL